MKNKEYDSFGPWIYEVNDISDIPKLFVPYCPTIDDALLVLKIPRNIERRNAKPGMDLYDYVLCVYEGYLRILKRVASSVEVIEIKHKDIITVRNRKDLLKGTVTFYLPKKTISVYYNTISDDLIKKFIKLIRDRYSENGNLEIKQLPDYKLDKGIDHLFINLARMLADNEEQFRIIAVQRSITAVSCYTSIYKKIIDFVNVFKERQLLNTMFLTNGRELLIITRGKSFGRPKMSVLSYDFTYIPINRTIKINSDIISEYENIFPVLIEVQDHIFKYYFDNLENQIQNLSKVINVSHD